MRPPLLLLIGCVLPLTACSTPPKGSTDPAVVDPVPHVADGGTMKCNPNVLEQFHGKIADEATVKQAVAKSGAKNARVVKPNMAVTMDFREDRLTINVDAQNKIVSIGCN